MEIPVKSLILMILLAFGMFYGHLQFKNKGTEWGKFLSIVCGISIVITALFANLCTEDSMKKNILREHKYERAQAIVLAKTLAAGYSGVGKCLVVHYPTSTKNITIINRIVEGFKEGFGPLVSEVVTAPIININIDDQQLHDDEWNDFTATDFNTVLRNNQDCDIVIFLLHLPEGDELFDIDIFKLIEDPLNSSGYKKDPNIKYPTVGVFNASLGIIHSLISEKLIKAASIWRPDLAYEENPPPAPDDVQEAFDKRFIMVTPNNIEDIKQKFPNLIPEVENYQEPVFE